MCEFIRGFTKYFRLIGDLFVFIMDHFLCIFGYISAAIFTGICCVFIHSFVCYLIHRIKK